MKNKKLESFIEALILIVILTQAYMIPIDMANGVKFERDSHTVEAVAKENKLAAQAMDVLRFVIPDATFLKGIQDNAKFSVFTLELANYSTIYTSNYTEETFAKSELEMQRYTANDQKLKSIFDSVNNWLKSESTRKTSEDAMYKLHATYEILNLNLQNYVAAMIIRTLILLFWFLQLTRAYNNRKQIETASIQKPASSFIIESLPIQYLPKELRVDVENDKVDKVDLHILVEDKTMIWTEESEE